MNRKALFRLAAAAAAAAALALPLLLSWSGPAQAQPAELEGVKLEPTVQVGGTALQLNGTLLGQKGPRRVAITMLRNVDAESFAGALNEGLRNNHSEAQLAGFKSQIDALNANLKAVGETRKGDIIHFEFTPEAGTRITVNGQPRGNPIPGDDFFTAVLRIWIGDKPADASLKKGLVGA